MNSVPHAQGAGGIVSENSSIKIVNNPGGGAVEEPQIPMDDNAVAVLASDSYDFGTVYEGNNVFHDFIIKNEGTADLKIIKVKSG
jgi:hypothetical protein